MSWWRNDDLRDDDDETEVKTLLLAFVILVSLAAVYAVMITGCAQHVKVFECKLDCEDKSSLECKASVSGSEIDLD